MRSPALATPGASVIVESPYNPGGDNHRERLVTIHLLMDDSHRRTYLTTEEMAKALRKRGFQTSEPISWRFPMPLNEEQVAWTREAKAEQALHMHQREDGAWCMELPVAADYRDVRVNTPGFQL